MRYFETVEKEIEKTEHKIFRLEDKLCDAKDRLESLQIIRKDQLMCGRLPRVPIRWLRIPYMLEFVTFQEKIAKKVIKSSREDDCERRYHIQDKIELLEKVKNYFREEEIDGDEYPTLDTVYTKDACEIAQFIDRLIEELEEEK